MKAILGFTRMSVRGLNKVKRELGFVLMALNIRKVVAQRVENNQKFIKRQFLYYFNRNCLFSLIKNFMSRTLKSIIIVILIFQNCCCYYYCFSFLLPFFLVITSSTCMLTSTTCKPVIYLTCSFTNSVTLRKIFGADSPYSKITFKSIAACFRQLLQKHQ